MTDSIDNIDERLLRIEEISRRLTNVTEAIVRIEKLYIAEMAEILEAAYLDDASPGAAKEYVMAKMTEISPELRRKLAEIIKKNYTESSFYDEFDIESFEHWFDKTFEKENE